MESVLPVCVVSHLFSTFSSCDRYLIKNLENSFQLDIFFGEQHLGKQKYIPTTDWIFKWRTSSAIRFFFFCFSCHVCTWSWKNRLSSRTTVPKKEEENKGNGCWWWGWVRKQLRWGAPLSWQMIHLRDLRKLEVQNELYPCWVTSATVPLTSTILNHILHEVHNSLFYTFRYYTTLLLKIIRTPVRQDGSESKYNKHGIFRMFTVNLDEPYRGEIMNSMIVGPWSWDHVKN